MTTFARIEPSAGGVVNLIFNPKDNSFYGTTGSWPDMGAFGEFFRLDLMGNFIPISGPSPALPPRPPGMILNPVNNRFYGTFRDGGPKKFGAVIGMNFGGATTILALFDETNGQTPSLDVHLLPGADGRMYGTTRLGGDYHMGTVYCLGPNGKIQTLHSFSGDDGREPVSGLVWGKDGFMYGTTLGGRNNYGVIFKISTAGDFTKLATFNDGNFIFYKQLVSGSDGNIYGFTSMKDDVGGYGRIFRLSPSGDLSTLVSFRGTNGSGPDDLLEGADGNLYGKTHYGGSGFNGDPSSGNGTIFRVLLHPESASRQTNIPAPPAHIMTSSAPPNRKIDNGPIPVAELQVLLSGTLQSGVPNNPNRPPVRLIPRLVPGADGNFYCSTYWGKSIIRLTPDGNLTKVVTFAGVEGNVNDLIEKPGDDGFYVTTTGTRKNGHFGHLYHVTLSGDATPIARFSENQINPPAKMIFNPYDNNFYGTFWGIPGGDMGFVIQMGLDGETRILTRFNGSNGGNPRGDIAVSNDSDGHMYGSTEGGGDADCGIAFSLSTSGEIRTLHSFSAFDGQWPLSGLVWGPGNDLYGTTAVNGKHGRGTVFQIAKTGEFRELTSFDFGVRPKSRSLCAGADGNIYGTTEQSPDDAHYGTIFRVSPAGDFRILYSFNGFDGSAPRDLIQGADGCFYGICDYGGPDFTGATNSGSGTVFRLVLH